MIESCCRAADRSNAIFQFFDRIWLDFHELCTLAGLPVIQSHFSQWVGVTPTGYVSFVSAAFPGAISDPEITRQSGLLTKLDDGDTIMADKGFTLAAADLQPRGLKFTLPPFREGNKQMPAQDHCSQDEESCE